MTLPSLAKPIVGKVLHLYLGVSTEAVSTLLVRNDGIKQEPMYFVSRLLLAEKNYMEIEQVALALVVATRKLRSYFFSVQIYSADELQPSYDFQEA